MNTIEIEYDFLSIISDGRITIVSNPIDEINLINNGLKFNAINQLRKQLKWELKTIAKVIGITPKALINYKVSAKPLNIKISKNTLELAKLATIGIHYFGNVERWNNWLNTPNIQSDNNKPITIIHTIRERELIKKIILKLQYGFTA